MDKPTWYHDGFSLALAVPRSVGSWLNGRLTKESADRIAREYGIGGYMVWYKPNVDAAMIVPALIYSYKCECGEVVAPPFCPKCGAEAVARHHVNRVTAN